MRTKRFLLIFIAATFLISLAAMNAGAEKVLKVGIMGPFTGPAAQSGNSIKDSLLMKLEEAGNKVGDYKLEIIFIDSQSDPAKATSAYVEAIERKGMQVGLGGWHSSVAMACVDQAVKYKVPHMGSMGAAKTITDKIRSDPKYTGYWFKFWSYPALSAKLYFDFVNWAAENSKWNPKEKVVGVSAEETDWGRDWIVAAKQNIAEYGWKIADEDYMQIGQTDFYPLLTKYKNQGIPLVTTTNTAAASVSAFIKQAREIGLKSLMIVDGLGWVGNWYELTGRASDGIVDMNVKWGPRSQGYRKTFEKKYNFKPAASAGGISYDAAGMFLKLLKRTLEKEGKLDSESIHKVMVDEMVTGKLTYGVDDGAIMMREYKFTPELYPDPVTDQNHWFMPVIQYKGGKAYTIFPLADKEMDFMAPK
ncbi:MAG: ABC transporter substrate-binding protein [Deltaproteobacteria bacterium]|jgi:branched-chain amino acid transport system substrate-binding protein